MDRPSRAIVAALLATVLIAFAAPAAQALPASKPQPARLVAVDWLEAALSWLSHLLDRATDPSLAQQKKARSTSEDPTVTPTGAGGFNGSCIDPNGCTFGGGT